MPHCAGQYFPCGHWRTPELWPHTSSHHTTVLVRDNSVTQRSWGMWLVVSKWGLLLPPSWPHTNSEICTAALLAGPLVCSLQQAWRFPCIFILPVCLHPIMVLEPQTHCLLLCLSCVSGISYSKRKSKLRRLIHLIQMLTHLFPRRHFSPQVLKTYYVPCSGQGASCMGHLPDSKALQRKSKKK